MSNYIFDRLEKIDIEKLQKLIAFSDMRNKACCITWKEKDLFDFKFAGKLIDDDLIKLRNIIDSIIKEKYPVARQNIIGNIFSKATTEQKIKFVGLMNNAASFAMALDNGNYVLARLIIVGLKDVGAITEAEEILIINCINEGCI